MAAVFAGAKRVLPWLTVAMLGISDFVRAWGWWLLAALALGAASLRLALRNAALRQSFNAA